MKLIMENHNIFSKIKLIILIYNFMKSNDK